MDVLDSLAAEAGYPTTPDGIRRLHRDLSRLAQPESRVLKMLYGLDGNPMPIAEVEATLGLSRQRINALRRTAIRTLRIIGPRGIESDATDFLLSKEQQLLQDTTLEAYRHDLEEFTKYVASARPLEWSRLRQVIEAYARETSARFVRPGTLGRKFAVVREFLKYLHSIGRVSGPVLRSIPVPRQELEPNYLPADAVRVLLSTPNRASALGARDAVIMELLYSGLRLRELLSLTVESISSDYLIVPISMRRLRLPIEASRVIDGYLRDARESLTRKGQAGSSVLLLNDRGGALSSRAVRQIVTKYARRAGLGSSVSPTTLRHSLGVHMVQVGVRIPDVRRFLGNVGDGMVRWYRKWVPHDRRDRDNDTFVWLKERYGGALPAFSIQVARGREDKHPSTVPEKLAANHRLVHPHDIEVNHMARHPSVKELGRRIRRARTEKKISRAVLAFHVGVSGTLIQKWEEGNTWPKMPDFLELARLLGKPYGYFLEGIQGPTIEDALLELGYVTESQLMEARSRIQAQRTTT